MTSSDPVEYKTSLIFSQQNGILNFCSLIVIILHYLFHPNVWWGFSRAGFSVLNFLSILSDQRNWHKKSCTILQNFNLWMIKFICSRKKSHLANWYFGQFDHSKLEILQNWSAFFVSVYLKSVNLQYNTLVCWADGTNDSWTKLLMFQVLFFFIKSCKILCKNPFNLFLLLFYKITKMKIKSFECPNSLSKWFLGV